MAARIVRVQAEVVSQTMWEESHAGAGIENVDFVAFQDADGEEAFDGDFVGARVDIVP